MIWITIFWQLRSNKKILLLFFTLNTCFLIFFWKAFDVFMCFSLFFSLYEYITLFLFKFMDLHYRSKQDFFCKCWQKSPEDGNNKWRRKQQKKVPFIYGKKVSNEIVSLSRLLFPFYILFSILKALNRFEARQKTLFYF